MKDQYQDVCELVLRYKEHRDNLIRRTVIALIPTLATYDPQLFSTLYLHKAMGHLLGQLKKDRDRSTSFVAIGHVATAVESEMKPFLDQILASIKEGLLLKG